MLFEFESSSYEFIYWSDSENSVTWEKLNKLDHYKVILKNGNSFVR